MQQAASEKAKGKWEKMRKSSMRLKRCGEWIQYSVDGGNVFFYNEKTGEFQWERPVELADAPELAASSVQLEASPWCAYKVSPRLLESPYRLPPQPHHDVSAFALRRTRGLVCRSGTTTKLARVSGSGPKASLMWRALLRSLAAGGGKWMTHTSCAKSTTSRIWAWIKPTSFFVASNVAEFQHALSHTS